MLNLSLASSLDFTGTIYGLVAISLFVIAYLMVVSEDLIKLRKSKPVVIAAGLIWVCVALTLGGLDSATIAEAYTLHNWIPKDGDLSPGHFIGDLVLHHVGDFAQLFLFLMVAMTYVSAIAERNVFLKINAWLVSAGFGLRAVFWATGALAFCISPIADNLTTALLMGAVVVTVGGKNVKFVALACCNIVVARPVRKLGRTPQASRSGCKHETYVNHLLS